MATARPADYVPAARFDFLTPVFDAFVRGTTRERTFKDRLLHQARLDGDLAVLDLGSGTGTLAIWAKQRNPRLRIRGLDGDPAIIARAQRKAAQIGLEIDFDEGYSYALPYPDASFDRVLSSLFFHHLVLRDKERTIREVARVLRPGGELHVGDWGRPRSLPARLGAVAIRRFDGDEPTRDNLAGRLPELFEAGGLTDARERERIAAPFGVIALYSARRP
ncbi:MAG TPA: class I SAM-dependent methyltransferase [Thermoleophilaceae bacterium]|nr:class I SAM-dependent methyltransferase [Thermoleophilaceae bacterium]